MINKAEVRLLPRAVEDLKNIGAYWRHNIAKEEANKIILQILKDLKELALFYPAADDTAAVLAFRKSCGYPDDASGYGLPMETDDQKSIMSFIHKCQLDPIAANAVVKNISEIMAADEQERKQAFTDNYNKVVAGWGESKKENESLVNKGMSLMKLNQDNLRGISESIGMEAALSIMMLLGKTQTDHSGVSGGDSEDGGSLLDYISGKRG